MDVLLLSTEHSSELPAVRTVRELLSDVIKISVPSRTLRNTMELCLSEVATNVVEHNPSATWFKVSFGRNTQGWWLSLEDNGDAWDPLAFSCDDVLDMFTEEESGRGVGLVKALTDDIQYQEGQPGQFNSLRLIWNQPDRSYQPSVLIVEDDPSQRRLYEAYLAGSFKTLSVPDGESAIKLIREQDVDLVLSDIRMPGMSGIELREKLAEDDLTNITPFIFLTSESSAETQAQAVGMGIDDYLIKPVNKALLIQTIDRVLERSKQIYKQLTSRINSRISASMKPTAPEQSHHWNLQARSRNTGVGGGDMILQKDFESHLLIALIDIMGHDEVSKFFSYAYGGYLRGLMSTMDSDNATPSKLLESLSDSAFQDELLGQITLTCCTMAFEKSGRITIASAGHPSPLHITHDSVTEVPVGGMLPGLMNDTEYDAVTLQLKAPERLAIFTDGLYESADDNEGRHHLEVEIKKELQNTLHLPLDKAIDQIMERFDELAGTPPNDDTLLLLIEPTSGAQSQQ